jgi:hypothetical protein
LLPLDVMPARMRDEALPNGQRVSDEEFEAAVAAAPCLHPRLAATTINANVNAEISGMTAERRRTEVERLLIKRAMIEGPVIEGQAER